MAGESVIAAAVAGCLSAGTAGGSVAVRSEDGAAAPGVAATGSDSRAVQAISTLALRAALAFCWGGDRVIHCERQRLGHDGVKHGVGLRWRGPDHQRIDIGRHAD
jgi:hypothetical protein